MTTITINNQEFNVSLSMRKSHGYGQYKIVADVEGAGIKKQYSFHSTDSQLWDDMKEIDSEIFESRLLNIVSFDLDELLREYLYFINE